MHCCVIWFLESAFTCVSVFLRHWPLDYDSSQDRFYLEAALRDYAYYIAGLRASFSIDWDVFGPDRANRTVSVWDPQWDRPDWLVEYNPPGGTGSVIDYFAFGTDENGDLLWFNMVNWDIPPFFSIAWVSPSLQGPFPSGALEFYNGFATWVSGPCPNGCSAEVSFYARPGGKLGIGGGGTAPSPVPLPAPALLLLSALGGLAVLRRRAARPSLHPRPAPA